jgi:hypothetical protein
MFDYETMESAKKRSRRVSSLSNALRILIERAEIEDSPPLVAVAEALNGGPASSMR